MELGGGGGGSVDSPHSDEEMERVMVSAEEEGESLIDADGSDEEMGGGGSSSANIGGRVESLEIGDGLSDKSSSAEPEVMNRGPRYPLLNEEFAVGNECKGTWAQELGGGVCDALCVAVEDDDPTAGCNQVTACLCGLLLKAERVGNMPVLYARRPGPGKPSQLVCLVGPFWPCLMGVTYPLILGVSLFSAVFLLPDAPVWAVVAWAICTVTLVAALSLTACTNPGIVRRYRDEPPPNTVRAFGWLVGWLVGWLFGLSVFGEPCACC